ncbi:glycine-rich domain-containing protein [Helicobacter heilmannii]|uniref:glycine-rich domain-containing protein n=1 Tax=Helicobacter heilmannii TaxID=35817 RepID=UPI000B2A883C|nr:hypothetical protein [Helicobacter heilmannii]BDQ26637.1 hypothetical protein ASB1_03130 [Helicobacter heilmannii]
MVSVSVMHPHGDRQMSLPQNEDFVATSVMDNTLSLVNSVNFDKLNAKLVDHYGWSKEEVSHLCSLYKGWLALQICYPDVDFAPNEKLDEYWHMHILDTRAYTQDCLFLFGEYLHHYPYFGLEGDADDLERAFERTRKFYAHHFGESLIGDLGPCKPVKCK